MFTFHNMNFFKSLEKISKNVGSPLKNFTRPKFFSLIYSANLENETLVIRLLRHHRGSKEHLIHYIRWSQHIHIDNLFSGFSAPTAAVVFDQAGLKIDFSYSLVNEAGVQYLVANLVALNSTPSSMESFLFQAAVTKVYWMNIKHESSYILWSKRNLGVEVEWQTQASPHSTLVRGSNQKWSKNIGWSENTVVYRFWSFFIEK